MYFTDILHRLYFQLPVQRKKSFTYHPFNSPSYCCKFQPKTQKESPLDNSHKFHSKIIAELIILTMFGLPEPASNLICLW